MARFDAFAKRTAPAARYERVPMLRGRIVSANGVRAEDLKAAPNASWVLQSDRGITYAGDVPGGSRVVAGEWWGPNYQGPPLVSFEAKIADGLGLKIGDPIVVNVLGRNIPATLANTRAVDWQSRSISCWSIRLQLPRHRTLIALTSGGGGPRRNGAAQGSVGGILTARRCACARR